MVKWLQLFIVLIFGLLLAACSATSDTENDPVGSGPILPAPETEEGPAARGQAGITSDAAAACLSAEEGELIRLINAYRATNNLPAVQASKSLTLVAQQHAWDSVNNSNAWPAPPAGKSCNMHSWSGNVNPALQQGKWTGVCFTGPPDWDGSEGMWNKPRELAGYPGNGFENSYMAGGGATAAGALEAWKNSAGHNAVITQQNGWGPFNAMGVGISGGVAHLWFGGPADPAGEAMLCSGGSVGDGGAAPTAVPPTAVPPTAVPPTAVPPTAVPPTAVPPTAVPPTAVPPTAVPPTAVPATAEPTVEATAVPATAEPTVEATAVPATAEPTVEATAVPATAEPTVEATAAAPTGQILLQSGVITAGGSGQHTFDVVQGANYTVLVAPADDFDANPSYSCSVQNLRGNFDLGFEGDPEIFTYNAPGNGTCTITVAGYEGSTGTYDILVTAQ